MKMVSINNYTRFLAFVKCFAGRKDRSFNETPETKRPAGFSGSFAARKRPGQAVYKLINS
jgi:hypothetical protein